jgi:hypothetical protein
VTSARLALGTDAVIDQGDARTAELPASRAVLLFDVLHMLPYEDQDRILARVVAALEPGGVLILREADASGGWRFQVIRVANRLKGVFEGDLRRRLCFRSAGEWVRTLEQRGFEVRLFPLDQETPLANILLQARRV